MNSQEARKILALYRPGTADEGDPAFKEALKLAEQDQELRRWFEGHCAVYSAIRGKFKQVRAPEGLKEQILAERKVEPPTFRTPRRSVAVVGAALVLAAVAVMLYPKRPDPNGYPIYLNRMTQFAARAYGMMGTTNLAEVADYMAKNGAPAHYSLPKGLASATTTGCTVVGWQTDEVSMICFKTGRPLPRGDLSDLYLFVADRKRVRKVPEGQTFSRMNTLTTVTWTDADYVYVLATTGDESVLKKFL